MADTTATVELSGPMFRDPLRRRIVKQALRAAVHEVALIGERRVKEELWKPADFPISRHGVDTGFYKRHVSSRVINDTTAEVNDQGVVYGPWLESGGRGTRFRGYGMFRKAITEMERRSRGVLRKRIRKAAAQLNGGIAL